MNKFTLSNGKIVEYEDRLVYGGTNIYVTTKLTATEKKEFKKEIKWERDVVSIKFLT